MSIAEVAGLQAEKAGAGTMAEQARTLAGAFAGRSAAHDRSGSFVAENYADLKKAGFFSAAVPAELGGGDAGLTQMCEAVRLLGQGCSSTALAFSMHTHQVVIPAWRWRNQPAARPVVEPLLKRVADGAILLSSGGGDWIGGSGRAEKAEGGWRVHATKSFVSGAPAGDLLMTGVVSDEGVLHFALPMAAPEVQIRDTWDTLGMRGTGSQDVVIDGFFLADDKVALKRKPGEWHLIFHITVALALPLIYSAYLGVAESARDLALGLARKRVGSARQPALAGEMDTVLRSAQMAHRHMLDATQSLPPGPENANEVMIGRQLVERSVIRTVELALEVAQGVGFYRAAGLEQKFRDIQAARYHPMRREAQALYCGSMALGDPVDKIY